jgi:hypothetical protein
VTTTDIAQVLELLTPRQDNGVQAALAALRDRQRQRAKRRRRYAIAAGLLAAWLLGVATGAGIMWSDKPLPLISTPCQDCLNAQLMQ